MSEKGAAVEALDHLGLTEYEAKCFVALTRVEEGTAKEVSEISGVPRARVYDTVKQLHKRGLVDVQQSEPRRYRAISKEDAFERLHQEYKSHIEAADNALDEVTSAETQEEKGMWAIADTGHVSDRMVALIDDAEDHIHFIFADETWLEDNVPDRLAAASDRDVEIIVEVPSESVKDRIQQVVPDAHTVVMTDLRETYRVVKKWPGQLIMVDHQAVLASGVEQSNLPQVERETAVWTHGRDHGFAAWTREFLQDRVTRFELSE